ncbi:MAG: phosphoribosyltransferase [Geminicoccaceae bacterium]
MRFTDRADAGRQLAERLAELRLEDPVVLALPRGGVPVALEVARLLGAPLDLVMVRKIGAPGHEELAAGAVVDGRTPELVLNPDIVRSYGIDQGYLAREQERQLAEIARRRAAYLGDRPRVSVAGHSAIVIDDGIATGATVRAALHAVRRGGPEELILAVPVADAAILARLDREADRIVCLYVPTGLTAVGQYYRDFRQVEDAEVVAMLSAAREQP